MHRYSAAILVGIACLAALANAKTTSLMFQVEPKTEDCLSEELPPNTEVSAQSLVIRGGRLDIRMKVIAPGGNVLYNELIFSNVNDETGEVMNTIVKKGHTFRTSGSGPESYKFCFDNTMSRWTAKVVDFDLSYSTPSPIKPPTGDDGSENAAIQGIARRMVTKVNDIELRQSYHFHREERHRTTAESNNSRILWFTVLETVVLLACVTIQISVIRRWFQNAHHRSNI